MPLPSDSMVLIGTTIRSRIFAYLKEKGYPISSSEIAQKLNISPNSVRPMLTLLLREGKILRPYRGYYSTKPIHGVEDKLPTVHNLIMKKSGYRFSR
jgi:DNA-binding Lrp family transcriptional regulator